MKRPRIVVTQWCLFAASTLSLIAGAVTLQSCGGEGGAVGGGAGGSGNESIAKQFNELLPVAQRTASFVGSAQCGECHNGNAARGENDPIFEHWQGTMHADANVGCEQCHGPGSVHANSPSEENILTFPKSASPIVCAQCHGKLYDEWKQSSHSQIVPDPVEEAAINPGQYGRNSQCFVCHSGLVRNLTENQNLDVYFDGSGLTVPTLSDDQIRTLVADTEDWVPHTATCTTCHNPHKTTGNLTDDAKEVQLWHKTYNTDTTNIAPGTTASQFVYYDHVCAECHNGRGASATDAKLNTSTARPNMHDSNQFNMLMGIGGYEGSGPVIRNTAHAEVAGQCSHCHMPGGRHTFTVSYDVSCQPCHTAADAAARVTAVKAEVVNALYALQTRMEAYALNKFGDADLWDYTSVIQALDPPKTPPNQADVEIQVKRARHNYYFVVRDRCFGPHNAPYAMHLINVANDELDTLGVPPASVAPSGRSQDSKLQELMQRAALASKVDHEALDD